MAKLWSCGKHRGVIAPGSMRKKDVRRYCWPCSLEAGELVERVLPGIERKRQAERAQRERLSEAKRAEAAAARSEKLKAERAAQRRAIERYARYCGPAVLAKVLKIRRTSAAKRLAKWNGTVGGGTSIGSLERELRDGGMRVEYHRAAGTQTLKQWRGTHPNATAIVRLTSHYVYLSSGRLVEHNGLKSSRATVHEVLWIRGRK